MRLRRFACRVLGHVQLVPVIGRVQGKPAIASACPRCKRIVELRAASRQDRRRAMFGR